MNPYLVLGISDDADDAAVRKAYIALVNKYPPEHNGEVFKNISNAYDLINSEHKRLNYRLFNMKPEAESPMDMFAPLVAIPANRKPLSFDKMKEFLQKC